MKRYVINLDRAPDRLELIKEEFSKLGLDFIRVPAIDWKDHEEEFQRKYSDAFYVPENVLDFVGLTRKKYIKKKIEYGHRFLSLAQVACWFSHRKCFKLIAEGSEPYGAVFEDDAYFSEEARYLLENSDWIDEGIDFIKLDHYIWPNDYHPNTLLGKKNLIPNRERSSAKILSLCYGLAGYVISRECAKRLYAITEYPCIPIDSLLFDSMIGVLNKFNMYQIFPAVIRQQGLESSIHAFNQPRLFDKATICPKNFFIRKKNKFVCFMRKYAWPERLRNMGQSSYWGPIFFKE